MRSHEEQRQQPTSYEGLRKREAVKPPGYAGAPSSSSAPIVHSPRKDQNDLLEKMMEGDNLRLAYKRVVQNGGAPGVDSVTVAELQAYLKTHWETVKAELRSGTYRPAPVKWVEIPKPGGGVRMLGIPTVMERFLQQALLQILTPIFDGTFSWYSCGFRPGKRAHDAVYQAQSYIKSGLRLVVDMDLEKFFDRVNHVILMARVARRVKYFGIKALWNGHFYSRFIFHDFFKLFTGFYLMLPTLPLFIKKIGGMKGKSVFLIARWSARCSAWGRYSFIVTSTDRKNENKGRNIGCEPPYVSVRMKTRG